jgi:hypothetical protein
MEKKAEVAGELPQRRIAELECSLVRLKAMRQVPQPVADLSPCLLKQQVTLNVLECLLRPILKAFNLAFVTLSDTLEERCNTFGTARCEFTLRIPQCGKVHMPDEVARLGLRIASFTWTRPELHRLPASTDTGNRKTEPIRGNVGTRLAKGRDEQPALNIVEFGKLPNQTELLGASPPYVLLLGITRPSAIGGRG